MAPPTLAPDTPPELIDLDRKALRLETPCGTGTMVWRKWGAGEPIVLLHGAHGFWGHWVRNIEALAEHYELWVPDLPGMSDSAAPDGEDHAAIVRPIAAGLRQLLPGRSLPVVGFSFGGVLSPYLATIAPEAVSRMIIIGSGGIDTPLGDIKLHRVKGLDPERQLQARKANLLAVMLHHASSADALALWIQERGTAQTKFNPNALIMPDWLVIALRDVSTPLDAIWGAFDGPHPDPASQEAALRRYRPDMRFRVVPNAGHWCQYENPNAFNATLLELLRLS